MRRIDDGSGLLSVVGALALLVPALLVFRCERKLQNARESNGALLNAVDSGDVEKQLVPHDSQKVVFGDGHVLDGLNRSNGARGHVGRGARLGSALVPLVHEHPARAWRQKIHQHDQDRIECGERERRDGG